MTTLQVGTAPGPEAMGRTLRELRQARELPQAEVAAKLGVSPAYLSLIETGKRPLQLPLVPTRLLRTPVQLRKPTTTPLMTMMLQKPLQP